MSRHNVELHRRALEAFNARDVEAAIALCDPQIELDSALSEVGGIYRGHDGLRKYFQDLEDAWGNEIGHLLGVQPRWYPETVREGLQLSTVPPMNVTTRRTPST